MFLLWSYCDLIALSTWCPYSCAVAIIVYARLATTVVSQAHSAWCTSGFEHRTSPWLRAVLTLTLSMNMNNSQHVWSQARATLIISILNVKHHRDFEPFSLWAPLWTWTANILLITNTSNVILGYSWCQKSWACIKTIILPPFPPVLILFRLSCPRGFINHARPLQSQY